MVAFGFIGLASHERSVDFDVIARSVLPFVFAWLVITPWAGVLKPNTPRLLLLGTWLVAGIAALVGRAAFFDRELFTAFFVIALVGNGLFLLAWRTVYDFLLSRDAAPAR